MKDYSTISLKLSQSELITLSRFFHRGVSCANYRHDGYYISTGGTDGLSKKLKTASKQMKILKAKHLAEQELQ